MISSIHRFACLAVCLAAGPVVVRADDKITFRDHVQPVLANACSSCHNPDKKKGGLDLTSVAAILAGGSGGALVEPGNPGNSRLMKILRQEMEPKMPPDGPKMEDPSVAMVEKWIAGGLPDTKTSAPVAKKSGPDLSFQAKAGKPDGPPAMPAWLPIEPIRTVERHGPVTALAASPWAPLVAVGGERQIAYYHLDTLAPLGVLDFPEGGPFVLRFSSDGRWLLAAGGLGAKSGRVVVWEVTTGRRKLETGRETDAVLAADIRPDLSEIALGGPARKVKIYHPGQDDPAAELKKHTDWLTAGSYSPDGVLLATGDRNGGVQVWESDGLAEFHSLRGHEKGITATAWRPDGNLLATASEDGTIRFWDMNTGNSLKSFPAHAGGTLDAAWSQDGQLVSAGRDKKLKLWKSDGSLAKEWVAGEDALTRVAFAHDGKRVICGDFTGNVGIWSTDGNRLGGLAPNPPTLARRMTEDTLAREQAAAQLPAARATAAKAAADLAPLTGEAEALKARLADAEKSARESAAARDRLAKEHESQAAGLAAMEATLAESVARIAPAMAAVDQSTQSASTARTSRDESAAAREVAAKSLQDRQAARDQAVAARDADPAHPEKIAAAQNAENLLQEAVAAMTAADQRLAAADTAMRETMAARDAAQARLAQLQADQEKHKSAVESARATRQKLAADLDAATTAANQAAAVVPPMQARLAEISKALPDLTKAAADAEATCRNLSATLDACDSRLRRWQAEPLLLEVRAAHSLVWKIQEALATARAGVDAAALAVESAVRRRDQARATLPDASLSGAARLFYAQSVVNATRRRHTQSLSHADAVENSLARGQAAARSLEAAFLAATSPEPAAGK